MHVSLKTPDKEYHGIFFYSFFLEFLHFNMHISPHCSQKTNLVGLKEKLNKKRIHFLYAFFNETRAHSHTRTQTQTHIYVIKI